MIIKKLSNNETIEKIRILHDRSLAGIPAPGCTCTIGSDQCDPCFEREAHMLAARKMLWQQDAVGILLAHIDSEAMNERTECAAIAKREAIQRRSDESMYKERFTIKDKEAWDGIMTHNGGATSAECIMEEILERSTETSAILLQDAVSLAIIKERKDIVEMLASHINECDDRNEGGCVHEAYLYAIQLINERTK